MYLIVDVRKSARIFKYKTYNGFDTVNKIAKDYDIRNK